MLLYPQIWRAYPRKIEPNIVLDGEYAANHLDKDAPKDIAYHSEHELTEEELDTEETASDIAYNNNINLNLNDYLDEIELDDELLQLDFYNKYPMFKSNIENQLEALIDL